MNKKLIYIFALLPALAIAEERTVEQAAIIAQQFMTTQVGHRAPGQAPLTCAYTQAMPNLDREAFYVFNNGEKGFVMVSAETNTPEIIGYSNENTFGDKNMPAHIQAWFDNYAQQIEWLAQHPNATAYMPSQSYTLIEPLLKRIEWGQNTPYNNMCPIMPNEKSRSVVGCTATATAQIMGYYQWPKHSKGQHSLPYDRSIILDYDKDGEYDWDNILMGNYYYTTTTPKQDSAIAKLMWHVGVACDMQYSANGSGASEVEMAYRMIKHFDYDQSMQEYYLDNTPTDSFVNMLYQQLLLKQPCLMTGYTTNWEGHAFVCDGIDEKGLLHINWGWDGVANGNFRVTLLDPNNQGTGGSASNLAFTQYVAAIMNIKPNEGGARTPSRLSVDTAYYYGASLIIDRSAILPIRMRNISVLGLWDFAGKVGLGIYQDGQFVQWFKQEYYNISYALRSNIDMSNYFPKSLSNGHYDLYLCYQSDGQDKVDRILQVYPFGIHLEVTDTQIIVNGGIDLTMSDINTTLDDQSVQLSWTSQAPYFRVHIASAKRVFVDSIISESKFAFSNDSVGIYYYTIQPLTKDKTESVWRSKSGEVFLSKTCPITNLQYTGEEYSVVISWVSEAPKFLIEAKKGSKKLASNFITANSITFTEKKGTYTFFVTPYDESELYPIGETLSLEIKLPCDKPDALNHLHSTRQQTIKVINGQQIILKTNNHNYNLLGNEQD